MWQCDVCALTVKTTLVCSAGTKAMSGHGPDCDDLTVCDYTTVRGQAVWTDRTVFSHAKALMGWRRKNHAECTAQLKKFTEQLPVFFFCFKFGNMQKNMSHVSPLLHANTHVLRQTASFQYGMSKYNRRRDFREAGDYSLNCHRNDHMPFKEIRTCIQCNGNWSHDTCLTKFKWQMCLDFRQVWLHLCRIQR